MLTMDKFDGDSNVGFDLDGSGPSFSIRASGPVAMFPFQTDATHGPNALDARRSQRFLTRDLQTSPAPRRELRKQPKESGKSPGIDQAESNPGSSETTQFRTPLDIYCSEIRRLNHPSPEDEQRFQVRLSEISHCLVQTISRFPGSPRYLLVARSKTSCTGPSDPDDRSHGEFDFDTPPVEERCGEASWMEAGEQEEFEGRVVRDGFERGIPETALLDALAQHFDDLCRAARRHGIFHEITRQHRIALSEAFCKLPLTPICIETLVARLNSLLENSQQTRKSRGDRDPPCEESEESGFEPLYAIGFDEFEQIAREASSLHLEWQKIRNRIAEFHVGLVVYLARQYSSEPQELIDLIQEGNIGLIKAVERFDYRLGFRFSTYATYWIRLAMSRYLARSSRAVRLPYRQCLHIGTVRKKQEHFKQMHGRAPTTLELARVTGISEAGLRKLEIISQAIASLDAQVEPGENLDLMSVLEQQVFNQPYDEVERQNMNGLIERAIGGLNQREAYVIRQRFGIGVCAEKTLQELGAVLGLTRERIRQIELGALKKIRRWLEPLAV